MSEQQRHQTIWLQPWCDECDSLDVRCWSKDDDWSQCEECGQKSVEYLLADAVRETVIAAAIRNRGGDDA